MGRTREAEETKQAQQNRNESIMLAFQKKYDFSTCYFFYSYDSENIQSRDFSKLFDYEGKRISKDQAADIKAFYMAEFRTLDLSKSAGMGGGGFEGLVVHDSKFEQLEKPFPYYTRTMNSVKLFRKSPSLVVGDLNKQLHKFYN